MNKIINVIYRRSMNVARRRFHPLYRMRRSRGLRYLASLFDFPMTCSLYGVNWKVRLQPMRNLSWVLNSRDLEPGMATLLLGITKVYASRIFWGVVANVGFYSWLLLSSRNKQYTGATSTTSH